jgi:ATP-binding cassette subfamily C protein
MDCVMMGLPRLSVDCRLAEALAACRRHLAYAAGFSAIINILYLAPTLYMLQVYDRVVPSRGVMTLGFLTLLLLASLATLAFLEFVRSRILVRASGRLERTLAASILAATLDPRLRAKSSQSIRDFDILRQAVTGAGVLALFDAPWTLVYIALCFLLHPLVGLMAMLGSGALIALTVATEHATRPRMAEANQAAAWSYASVAESAGASEIIRSLGMQEALTRRHQTQRVSLTTLQAQASFSAGGYMSFTRFIRMSLQSLALGAAAFLAVNQQISAGAIFAASLLIARALAPIEQVIGSWKSLTDAQNAYGALKGLLASMDSARPRTLLPEPAAQIAAEQVTVLSPGGERPLVQGVSFAINPGQVVGLVGPSGAGKTTLIRALVGAVAPVHGQVRIDGAKISDWDSDRLGRHLGYLPQEVGLLQGTVKQNICRFRDGLGEEIEAIDAKVVAAAKSCGAHDMILKLPMGYDTMLDWQGRGLSLGQAQRVGLARAFFDEPKLVVLDEPNAHLDMEGELALMEAIVGLKARGAAVIVVAHRASLLQAMDQLIVLTDGRLVDSGGRDDVLARLNPSPNPVHRLVRELERA